MHKVFMILFLVLPTCSWADDFDYYVLSLSWSASFCDIEGDAKRSKQLTWITNGFFTACGHNTIKVGRTIARQMNVRPRVQ